MSTITIQRINDHIVRPIPINVDLRKVKGASICAECYCNIFLIAPTNSGKTTAMFKLMKECVGRDTIIIAFVSTLYNDANWIYIKKYFEKKGIEFQGYTSIHEDGVNKLNEIQQELEEKAKLDKDNEEEEDEPVDLFKTLQQENGVVNYVEKEETEHDKKKRKSKYQCPEYLLIFDDLADEIKSTAYETLLKKSRHYKIKTITSSQYLKDMRPSARKQIRLWLIFSGASEEQLQNVYSSMDLRMPFEVFYSLYKKATEITKSYQKPFFYIMPRTDDYRASFDRRFIIPKEFL